MPAEDGDELPAPMVTDSKPRDQLLAKFDSVRDRMSADDWRSRDTRRVGMVSPEEAVDAAILHITPSCSANDPRVVLADGIYVVRFFHHPNPFQAGKITSLDVGVDAWTGEYFVGHRLGGDLTRINIDKETGARASDDVERCKARLRKTTQTLGKNIFHGRKWDADAESGMIAREKALATAEKIVADRAYDKNENPMVTLVDDVYLVTFWKTDRSQLKKRDLTYDSRVGIDAYTGEFIAMETTK